MKKTISFPLLILLLIGLCSFSAFGQPTLANYHKLDAALLEHIEQGQEDVQIIVQYEDLPDHEQKEYLRSLGCTSTQDLRLVKGVVATCKANKVLNVAQDPLVKRIEGDFLINFPLNTTHDQVKADLAKQNFNVNGSGVVVAVIDSGINTSHPGLAGVDFGLEHNFFSPTEPADDGHPNSHGTRSACIIACTNDTFSGIAPGVTIMNGKVGDEGALPSAFIAALEWAVNNSADVALGNVGAALSNCSGTDILSDAVNDAYDDGLLVVAPAGNGGPNNSTLWAPGCAEHALTVGATSQTLGIAPFSSRGPTGVGLMKPDVVAPGIGIYAAEKVNVFRPRDGTSSAGPFVVGVAALMKEIRPDLTPEQMKSIIRNSTVDLGFDEHEQGTGFLDAEAAVNFTFLMEDPPEPFANLTHEEFFPDPAPKKQNFDFTVQLNSTGTTAANNTVVTIEDISPHQLNLVNNDPVHNLGSLAEGTVTNTTWIMKSNPSKTYTVTVSIAADNFTTEEFEVIIDVQ